MSSNAHWRYATMIAAIDRAYGPVKAAARPRAASRPAGRPIRSTDEFRPAARSLR
jgi:hypothetical protein